MTAYQEDRVQEIEWRTEPGEGVTLPWPDQDGPWLITLDLAVVDGRGMVVGLHLQSFAETTGPAGQPVRTHGPHGLTEVTHAVVRGLKMGQLAELGRLAVSERHRAERSR